MEAYLKAIDWRDIVTALSLLFGFITLLAYLEQRRGAKSQAVLLEFVRRNVDRDVSTELIGQLTSQREEMSRQVAEEIPRLARRAVLKEQAEVRKRAIAENYEEWRRICDELGDEAAEIKIDPLIEAAVLDKLLPEFKIESKLQQLRERLLILTIALLGVGIVFPNPLDDYIQFLFSIYWGSTLFKYMIVRARSENERRTVLNISRAIYFLICLGFAGLAVLLLFLDGVTDFGRIIGYATIGLVVIGLIAYRWFDKWARGWMRNSLIGG